MIHRAPQPSKARDWQRDALTDALSGLGDKALKMVAKALGRVSGTRTR